MTLSRRVGPERHRGVCNSPPPTTDLTISELGSPLRSVPGAVPIDREHPTNRCRQQAFATYDEWQYFKLLRGIGEVEQVVETTAPPQLPPTHPCMVTGLPDQAGSRNIKASHTHRFVFSAPKHGPRRHR